MSEKVLMTSDKTWIRKEELQLIQDVQKILQDYKQREHAYVELYREHCNCKNPKHALIFKEYYRQKYPDKYELIKYQI